MEFQYILFVFTVIFIYKYLPVDKLESRGVTVQSFTPKKNHIIIIPKVILVNE